MTALNQEDILQNTKTVVQGLEALRQEHQTIQHTLIQSLSALRDKNEESTLIEEKTMIVEKSLEMIDLGMGEAQVFA